MIVLKFIKCSLKGENAEASYTVGCEVCEVLNSAEVYVNADSDVIGLR